jgi:pimeloyl-ACP methyl ester carboxylesterase
MPTTSRRPASPASTAAVNVGSHCVAVTERGTRPSPQIPAVVVLTGAGDCQDSWTTIAERLADRTQVITYDRAGLGRTGRGPAPTVEHFLSELQAVLDARVPVGDYILVGHSLGGLIARLHAQQRAQRLAGLVQVDATPEQIADKRGVKIGFAVSWMLASLFKALSPLGVVRLLLRLRAFPLYPEQAAFEDHLTHDQRRAWHAAVRRNMGPRGGAGRELRAVLPCARHAQGIMDGVEHPQFGDLPLAVLTSHAWGDEWVDMQRELATRSRMSTQRVFDDRCHNIHMQHPDAVVEAVRNLLVAVDA